MQCKCVKAESDNNYANEFIFFGFKMNKKKRKKAMTKLSRIVCAPSLSQSKEKETQKLAFNDFVMYFNDLKNIDIWHFILFF